MSIGERIKFYRTKEKLTQLELAEAAGVSPSSITMYEHDFREPSAKALRNIAMALDVNIYMLFDDLEDIAPKRKCPPSSISMSEANINKPILIIADQGGKINDFL